MPALRRVTSCFVIAVALAVVAGCPRRTSNHCSVDSDCTGGTACDTSTGACHLPEADGGVPDPSSSAGQSGDLSSSASSASTAGSGTSRTSSGHTGASSSGGSGVSASGVVVASSSGPGSSSSAGGGTLRLVAPRLITGGARLSGPGITLDVQTGTPGNVMGAGNTQLDNSFLR